MQQTANLDVGKCDFEMCEKYSHCYRSVAQSSSYDFGRICSVENDYKWYMRNKNVDSIINSEETNNKESEQPNE